MDLSDSRAEKTKDESLSDSNMVVDERISGAMGTGDGETVEKKKEEEVEGKEEEVTDKRGDGSSAADVAKASGERNGGRAEEAGETEDTNDSGDKESRKRVLGAKLVCAQQLAWLTQSG
tara:strand:+ start:421 stop:777 length:357 start_codon:yes stop_codon:yes gene_type:complete